jgi:hypothetical protein
VGNPDDFADPDDPDQRPLMSCRIARGMSPWSLVSVGDRGFRKSSRVQKKLVRQADGPTTLIRADEYTSRSNHDGSEDQQQSPYIAPESDFDFDLDDAEDDSQVADTDESGDD